MTLFRCDECKKDFSSKARLATHFLRKIAAEKKKKDKMDFKCKWCWEYCESQLHLEQHIQLIHKRKRFRCDCCSFSTNYKRYLTNHEIGKHRPMWKDHRCLSCGALFATKWSLHRHQIMHTRQFPVSCHQCGKGFRSKCNLKRHRLTHKKKTTGSIRKKPGFQCDKCKEVFSQSVFLEKHMAKKHQKKKFPCEDCEYSTDDKSNLNHHRQAKHLSGVQKKHHCHECGKAFTCPSNLQIHGSVHSKQKPFSCKDCGKSFARKSDLARHDHSVHLKQKPYVCGECGKSFSRKENLKAHQEAEKGEKAECELCDGHKFANKMSLRAHQRQMHGDQPWYKCQFCPKALTNRGNLTRHEEMHRRKPIQID